MDEVQQVSDLPSSLTALEEELIEAPMELLDCLDEDELEGFLNPNMEEEEEEPAPSPMHALFAADPKTALFTPPPADTPSVEAISPIQINMLTELLVDKITIVIDEGITTTTVEVPDGHFKGATISIKHHYDTAPRSFNVQLSGSFDHLLDFGQNMKQLHKQLGERMPDYDFRIDAALSSDYHPFDDKQKRQRVQKPKKSR